MLFSFESYRSYTVLRFEWSLFFALIVQLIIRYIFKECQESDRKLSRVGFTMPLDAWL